MVAAVNDQFGGGIAMIVGVTLARLGFTDAFRQYVKGSMGKWIVLAGVVLALLGAWRVLFHRPETDDDQDHDHDHDHREPKVALLLLLPVLAVFLIAPPSLGTYAADRGPAPADGRGAGETVPLSAFGPLPPEVDGAVPLTLSMYNEREVYGGGSTLDGVKIRLVGLAAPEKDGSDIHLVRFSIACCAADAQANVVVIRGLPSPRPVRDQWIEVIGRRVPGLVDGYPVIKAESWIDVKAPAEPYE
ncbi:MAG: TIGR03943 family protein [Acidimicrobiia bacterium]